MCLFQFHPIEVANREKEKANIKNQSLEFGDPNYPQGTAINQLRACLFLSPTLSLPPPISLASLFLSLSLSPSLLLSFSPSLPPLFFPPFPTYRFLFFPPFFLLPWTIGRRESRERVLSSTTGLTNGHPTSLVAICLLICSSGIFPQRSSIRLSRQR